MPLQFLAFYNFLLLFIESYLLLLIKVNEGNNFILQTRK